MTQDFHLAHLRPTAIRALVVQDGQSEEASVGLDPATLRALLGDAPAFLFLRGGPTPRGVVLVCPAAALRAQANQRWKVIARLVQVLGTVVVLGPKRLRNGSTAWTSLTDVEIEFWREALKGPTPKRKHRRKES